MIKLKENGEFKDNCPAVIIARELLEEVHGLTKETYKKVNDMSSLLIKIESYVSHLPKLDTIAKELGSMNCNLIDAVAGKKQIPLISHLLIMAIMGAALLVMIMSKTSKDLSISPTGISINESQQNH